MRRLRGRPHRRLVGLAGALLLCVAVTAVPVLAGERALAAAEAPKAPYQAAPVTVVLGAMEGADVTIRSSFKPDRVVTDPDVKVLELRRAAAVLEL